MCIRDRAAAEALVEATGGKGDYAELLGLESDTNCQVRSNAFHRVLDQTDMKMVAQQSANWDQTEGQSKAETILQQYPDICLLYTSLSLYCPSKGRRDL